MATPLCPYFGTCGGCSTQHLDYTLQLENKRTTLEREIGFKDIQIFSGEPYFYRNRMDMVFHPMGLGFRKKGDWKKVVPVEQCVISNSRLNELIKEITDFFKGTEIDAFDTVRRVGTFSHAILRTPGEDSAIAFVLNKDSTRVGEAVAQVEAFAKGTSARSVLVVYIASNMGADISEDYFVVKGTDTLEVSYLGKTFTASALGFFQVNDAMAEKMQVYVHELLKKYDTSGTYLLDLYGGVGTFGIINAPLFKYVTVVESVPSCIEAAKKNASANGVTNLSAVVLDAKRLKTLTFQKPLFVINDPPRSGMHPKTIEELKKLRPEVLIYISCNVEQLGKDLPKFRDYRLKSAALFDLFPQTNHMESVAELILQS